MRGSARESAYDYEIDEEFIEGDDEFAEFDESDEDDE
jgi:hypothetical protein